MLRKSFKLQILIIFLIPAFAMVYFSFYFVKTQYEELNKANSLMFTAKMTKSISRLIHNLQIERGLSAGYIVAKDKNKYKKQLIAHQKKSDKTYLAFEEHIRKFSTTKEPIKILIQKKNESSVKSVLTSLHNLPLMREDILNSKITFSGIIEFYSNINSNLINVIYVLVSSFEYKNKNSKDIYKLERIKEILGIQRAYIYNYILSKNRDEKQLERIRELVLIEKNLKNEFLNDASLRTLTLYNDIVKAETQKKLDIARVKLFQNKLKIEDAPKWFKISTQKINELEKLSIEITNLYFLDMKYMYNKAKKSLIITVILWILSLISFVILLYILNKLINSEAKLLEDLRILSYTFEAHEAVTITDPNGKILRVNKAFTRITGYEADEVIGQNPRVLKSEKHSEDFYRKMWHDLHTQGYWSGEIYNKRKNGEIYMERLSISAIKDEDEITTHYIAQFLDVSDLKKAQEEALHQASHDFLTKLPNRNSMVKKLHEEFLRAQRHNFLNAYLFIDLDNFKNINDTFGHTVGDKLLTIVAKRLRSCIRVEDYVARISGDEFCVMLLSLENDEEIAALSTKKICTKILDSISKPFFINEYKIEISASIGIKLFPDGTKNINDVISKADAAMYKAKENGKNKFVFFDKSIEFKIKEDILLEFEIKEALKNNQFTFYYQPKVYTDSKKINGAELLLRWDHPTKGILYPQYFLHVAKNIKIIPEITKMALQNACLTLHKIQNDIKGTISIDIDTSLLNSSDFIDYTKDCIKRYDVNPNKLEFEILEGCLIRNFDNIYASINELRELGIKFTIDNFGTGYSSLIYMRKIPLDTIKIDKYFIQNINKTENKKFIKMMLEISNTFELETIVDGVETKEQFEFIKQHGIKIYQGKYFTEAIDKNDFLSLIN